MSRLTEDNPSLKGVQPRGWPAGSTWDNVEGVYSPGIKRAVTAQFYDDRGGGGTMRSNRAGDVFRHEAGHAYDHSLNYESERPGFRRAYNADVKELEASSGWLFKKQNLSYFLQPGDAGPSEAFAELFMEVSGGKGTRNVVQHFPRSANYMRGLL